MSEETCADRITTGLSEFLDGELSDPQERDLLAALRADERLACRVVNLIQDDCILQTLHATADPRAFIERVLLSARYVDTGDSFADRVTDSVFNEEEMDVLPCEERQLVERIRQYAEKQLDAFLAQQREESEEQRSKGAGWDVSGTVVTAAETMGRLVRTGLRVVRVAVVFSLVLAMVLIFLYARANRSVATLADSMDAKWAVDIERQASLYKGSYRLDQGYARIVFQRGAGVWIEAPAEFHLRSANEMTLQSGRLFAEVPPSAKGFRVDTPYGNVVDLGTQFGIRVESGRASDLHMVKGKAALTSGTGSQAGSILTLTSGQAKCVDTSGQVQDIPIQDRAFVRRFSSNTGFVWRGQGLSLVDLVGHGNGLGNGQTNVYMDPIHGYTTSLYCADQDTDYHVLRTNPFVDGLFIPEGRTRQVISSQGHVFSECPQTNGECYTSLGANPNQGVWATDKRTGIIRFNGQDYGNHDRPCLVMHANLGITFDLKAIRAICPDIKITHFVSKVGLADFKEVTGGNADFWVLIDGQVRLSRRHVTQKDNWNDVSVPLTPADRFLTLATTDGGDRDRPGAYQRSYTCDWCVFGEPALLLETEGGPVNGPTR